MNTRRRPRVRIAARDESPKATASEDRSEGRARTGASGSQGNDVGPELAGVEA